jgi:hypothetical protein
LLDPIGETRRAPEAPRRSDGARDRRSQDACGPVGWIDDADPCPGCGALRVYAVAFDTYACLACNAWLDTACDDPECDYCRRRPPRPLPS